MKYLSSLKLKEKFILASILVILPVLISITLLTVKIVDNHNINNVKETIVKNSYLTHMFLYQSLNKIAEINPRNIYYLNLELSRMLNLRTQIYHQNSDSIFDSVAKLNLSSELKDDFKTSNDLTLALNNQKNYRIKNNGGNRFFLLTLPYFKGEQLLGAVRLIYPLQKEDLLKKNLLYTMSFINLIAFIIIIIFIDIFTRKIINPLKLLGQQVDQFSRQGKLETDFTIKSGDEVEELAAIFQKMAANITYLIADLKNEKNKQKLFYDNMTHEIRTPLTTIIGYANLLKNIDDSQKSAQALNYIESEGKRLLRLINEIIENSKLKAPNQFCLEKNYNNLNKLVEQSIEIMQYKAHKYNIEINFYADSEVEILLDQDKIKEVLLNIIDNAIVHSNSSKIDLTLENNFSRTILKIIDYGQGINFDYEKLLDNQMKKSDFLDGHGLGLNISKKIIESHNGKLIIDSYSESGTTVTIIFNRDGDSR